MASQRGIALLALMLALAGAACRSSVDAHFADRGYSFPLHVDRSARVPELGSAGFRAQTCREAPDKAALLARAVSAVRTADVARLARLHCPTALGVLLTDPFFADRGGPLQLAMRLECYGAGDPAPGITLDDALGASRVRGQQVERALDSWPVNLWRRGRAYWVKWNIALFAIEGERVRFRAFVERYDPEEHHSSMIIPEYVNELHALGACGRKRLPDAPTP